ncbi:MAG: copper homeostasis protein CutC [Negativicutes bacterium]|nr:copper homeostasis protein CutC [Negativicutes bacterium]
MIVEIIAASVDDAIKIEQGGADRIELVTSLSEGGLTPSYGLVCAVRAAVKIPVMAMIRPHAFGFCYSPADLAVMIDDIVTVRSAGVDGVVLGCLTAAGAVDAESLHRLLEVSDGIDVTFHRAIDQTADYQAAWQYLQSVPGIGRILTSGGPGRVTDNVDCLRRLSLSADRTKRLLIGGGMTLENCCQVLTATNADEIHFGTAVRCRNASIAPVDAELVKKAVQLVRSIRTGKCE